MLQKIIQVGNSAAVTIPRGFLREINGRIGSQVNVQADITKRQLILSWPKPKKERIIDEEVYRVAKRLLKRYRPVFEALAKKEVSSEEITNWLKKHTKN